MWGPSGADRTQVGPMLVLWTLLSRRWFLTQNTNNISSHDMHMDAFVCSLIIYFVSKLLSYIYHFSLSCHWPAKHIYQSLFTPITFGLDNNVHTGAASKNILYHKLYFFLFKLNVDMNCWSVFGVKFVLQGTNVGCSCGVPGRSIFSYNHTYLVLSF